MKILLVEDDPVIRQQVGKCSLNGVLKCHGRRLMEVLSYLIQSEPHLVLMGLSLASL